MGDYTSKETSTRLRDNGFPQPQPDSGQFWYDGDGIDYVILFDEGPDGICGAFLSDNGVFHEKQNEFDVFAPTATDILRELPPEYVLGCTSFDFHCFDMNDDARFFTHSNPSEACAAAWLAINEKKL